MLFTTLLLFSIASQSYAATNNFKRLKSFHQPNKYLHDDGSGVVKFAPVVNSDEGFDWLIVDVGNSIRIKNRKTNHYLNIDNQLGYLESSSINEVTDEGKWEIIVESGYKKFKSATFSSSFIHVNNHGDLINGGPQSIEYVQYGTPQDTPPAARWMFEDNGYNSLWQQRQAEDMTLGGGAQIVDATSDSKLATEAAGGEIVKLDATGEFLEFTSIGMEKDGMVIRFSMPDSATGGGIDATLGLYINDVYSGKLSLTSKYSWVYGPYPFIDDPVTYAGQEDDYPPRAIFDESRIILSGLQSGINKIRLQKDSDDLADYYSIDLVELEEVEAPRTMPSTYISVTDKGAIANDDLDDSLAFYSCINSAKAANTGCWIPPGEFNLDADAPVQSLHDGYTETEVDEGGYVNFTNIGSSAVIGSIDHVVGNYKVNLRYSNGTSSAKSITVFANGTETVISLDPTGGWDQWTDKETSVALPFDPGENKVMLARYYGNSGTVLVDSISIDGLLIEAEDGTERAPVYILPNTSIEGAGIWYTTLSSEKPNTIGGGSSILFGMGDNIHLSHFSMLGDATVRDFSDPGVRGILGNFGADSVIENVWIEHTRIGMQLGRTDQLGHGPTTNLRVENARVRNVVADGINFYQGTSFSTFKNNHVRNSGDDGLVFSQFNAGNNLATQNLVEYVWFAQGISMYNGSNNTMLDNVIYGSRFGIFVSTNFAHGITPLINGNNVIEGNFIKASEDGIKFFTFHNDISDVQVINNEFHDVTGNGIHFANRFIQGIPSPYSINNINIDTNFIAGAGLNGIKVSLDAAGDATFTKTTVRQPGQQGLKVAQSNAFTITKNSGNSGW